MNPETEKRWSNVFVIHLVGFLFSLHAALPAYIYSTFLSHYTSENLVGVFYSVSAILSILAFALIPSVLRKFGNYRTMLYLLFFDFFAIIGLLYTSNFFLVSICFIVAFVSAALVGFNIDVFLESFSRDSVTGRIRGTFLSTSNIAWIVAPLIASFILTDGDYWKIFIATALLLLPIMFLLRNSLRNFRDSEYALIPIKKTAGEIMRDKNIRAVFLVSFLLQFFYAWMVIYTPIYLHTYIGWSWREIGVMFSIMLVPFVLTEAPLGKLADSRWGEKEVMSVGFIVMALATGMISFIETKSFILWAGLLFVTRIGASMVEIMSETYFFKKIDSSRANIIGLFRTMRPWAYLVSPLVAMVLFGFHLPIKYIFIALALIMFLGLHWSLELEDTK